MTENLEKHKKLIRALIKQAQKLPHSDKKAFENLKKRTRMILKEIPAVKEFASSLLNIEIDLPSWEFPIQDEIDEKWKLAVGKITVPLELALEKLELFGDETFKMTELSDKIFIVHGHDKEMKESVTRTVEKLGLKTIILHEQPDKGRTIIQKFKDYSDVGFAIVLLSPDDEGRPLEGRSELRTRARQNVIFELGFFIGKLDQERVFIIYKEHGDFEFPSDYSGVLYTPYDDAKRWQYKIVEELQAAGYVVDANKLTKK